MQRTVRIVRSYFLAMRASSQFGRAAKLRDGGNLTEAMKSARDALAILSRPNVLRFNPAEGSVLSCATVLVEELAHELKVDGAARGDLVDALRLIRTLGPDSELTAWIPHLEQRVAQSGASAA
jgi:hypothetical protein